METLICFSLRNLYLFLPSKIQQQPDKHQIALTQNANCHESVPLCLERMLQARPSPHDRGGMARDQRSLAFCPVKSSGSLYAVSSVPF